MSRIYFHSPSADEEVSGTEHAWMGCLVDDIGMSTVDGQLLRRIGKWCDLDAYGKRPADFRTDDELMRMFRLALRSDHALDDVAPERSRPVLSYHGHRILAGGLTENTAMLIGAPHVQLTVRLHLQCEIHAWVDGPNRAWLADLIDAGLAARTFRRTPGRDGGWDAVCSLLRARGDEPVVTSYSVCDQFPDPEASTWMPAWPEGIPERWDALPKDVQEARSARREAWYELPAAEKWRMGMEYLRTVPGRLELVPEDFALGGAPYHFGGSELSWLDFDHWDAEERVRAALGLDDAEVAQ